ncbi:serine/threonine-protein kinase [Gemmatimonas sp.]|uniref:serine/threonine-protein kinase n=1 Tax=Gemmatimonas sp. TaxID=1962908 RepID=UPI003DA27B65
MTLGNRPALPTRFRFASGDGDRTSGRDELAVTLQARLHVVTIVLLAIGLLMSVIALWRMPEVSGAARTTLKAVQLVMGGIIPPVALLAWWLRPRTPRSIAALRLVEVGVFVSFNLLFESLLIADFPSIVPIIDSAPFDLGFAHAIIPCFFIVSYGLLIPNRWQRAAVMIGLMLALVAVTNLWSFSHYAVATNVMATFLGAQWTFLLAFTTMALFGANRIDRATAVARDALRLGQYVLVERLGAGGMGEVHRAEHRLLRRPCAIKLIRPEHAGNADVLRRFEREVQTTATLTHPNTIAIYDYGITDDGTFYYVMEYLPGDTLEQLVSRDGPMDAQRATHVLIQIAGALHEAHNAGLTHRDIKPGNVMLGERGGVADVAKLLDFGLVTAQNATGQDGGDVTGSITQVGMVLGTPAYMSPEQCAGEQQPGPASDLYSLGALGYFLVTGLSPFEGRAPLQMMLAHMNDTPPSARALRPELPADFDAILQQCLAKRPEDRFASARALEQALRGV